MLADVVALLLAFFVLSFSMRELDSIDRHAPLDSNSIVAPASLGAVATAPSDQLRAIDRPAASLPSFTYLTALILDAHATLSADELSHDDTMLTVELPTTLAPETDSELARLLLTLAFLARRFDLELAVDLPARSEPNLEARAERALDLQAWFAQATGTANTEVTFIAGEAPPASTAMRQGRARLAVKPATGEQRQ